MASLQCKNKTSVWSYKSWARLSSVSSNLHRFKWAFAQLIFSVQLMRETKLGLRYLNLKLSSKFKLLKDFSFYHRSTSLEWSCSSFNLAVLQASCISIKLRQACASITLMHLYKDQSLIVWWKKSKLTCHFQQTLLLWLKSKKFELELNSNLLKSFDLEQNALLCTAFLHVI